MLDIVPQLKTYQCDSTNDTVCSGTFSNQCDNTYDTVCYNDISLEQ